MRFEPVDPPRAFNVGIRGEVVMRDCGRISLDPDEQVTFLTESGGEYDVARKEWGFYATPSINGRLRDFGFRTVLVRNSIGRLFVLLVEDDKLSSFERYVASEQLEIVRWFDPVVRGDGLVPSCMCGQNDFELVHFYSAPPVGEIKFGFTSGSYERQVLHCRVCGHYVSHHTMDMAGMYEGEYATATYGDGLASNFERIMTLPEDQSDNVGRVRAVNEFASRELGSSRRGRRRLLDVGSGLGVFPARMKQTGWECTAIDPDPRVVEHLTREVGVTAIEGDFTKMDLGDLGKFDIVTFNKVLEHVWDPTPMLQSAESLILDNGFVYVEVPDGEVASREGFGREEFFIDHHHVFSAPSLALMFSKSGLGLAALERLQEPSGKYTCRAFGRSTPNFGAS